MIAALVKFPSFSPSLDTAGVFLQLADKHVPEQPEWRDAVMRFDRDLFLTQIAWLTDAVMMLPGSLLSAKGLVGVQFRGRCP